VTLEGSTQSDQADPFKRSAARGPLSKAARNNNQLEAERAVFRGSTRPQTSEHIASSCACSRDRPRSAPIRGSRKAGVDSGEPGARHSLALSILDDLGPIVRELRAAIGAAKTDLIPCSVREGPDAAPPKHPTLRFPVPEPTTSASTAAAKAAVTEAVKRPLPDPPKPSRSLRWRDQSPFSNVYAGGSSGSPDSLICDTVYFDRFQAVALLLMHEPAPSNPRQGRTAAPPVLKKMPVSTAASLASAALARSLAQVEEIGEGPDEEGEFAPDSIVGRNTLHNSGEWLPIELVQRTWDQRHAHFER